MKFSLTAKLLPLSVLTFIVSIFAATVMFAPAVRADDDPPTQKEDTKSNLCNGANLSLSGDGKCEKSDGDAGKSVDSIIKTVINVFTTIVGVVAVIFVIYGGFKFITAGGDSGKVASARNTIIYALIGLVVVALAQILVKFVINKATESSSTESEDALANFLVNMV